jgi:hypothetical protein
MVEPALVKKSVLADRWTFACPYLEMNYRDQVLACGSCFLWKQHERTFLVSNWHNFSGRDPQTGQPISDNGGVPSHINFFTFEQQGGPDEQGHTPMLVKSLRVPLYDDDLSGPRWLEHPSFDRRVDVAAIDVSDALAGMIVNHVNVLENDAVLEPFPSQDVFIIGYPIGRIPNAPYPVWKRGTLATDPQFDPEGLPKMYVDTATRKGMSGSVVIARHILVNQPVTKKDGTTTENYFYARLDTVLGIYSGRLGPHQVEAQLGIVWKRHVIEETLAGNRLFRG